MPENDHNSWPLIAVARIQAPEEATLSCQLNGKNRPYRAIVISGNDAKLQRSEMVISPCFPLWSGAEGCAE
jgi:hypothetical protein